MNERTKRGNQLTISGGNAVVFMTAAVPAFIGLRISSVLHSIPYDTIHIMCSIQVSAYGTIIENDLIVFDRKTEATHDAFLFISWQDKRETETGVFTTKRARVKTLQKGTASECGMISLRTERKICSTRARQC